jgi:thioesterase domain-containing protein
VLIGFSGSGPVAYEAAQQIDAERRRVHLILLDTAPHSRRHPTPDAEDSENAEDEPTPVEVRAASPKQLPGALVRSARFRWGRFRFERRVRNPGPPSFDATRYRVFRRILGDAARAYEPIQAAFAATLLHVEGNDDVVRRCEELIPDLTVHVVGGGHNTMLLPPEVTRLADLIAAAVDGAFTSTAATR